MNHDDLELSDWLKDGTRHTPTIPFISKYVASRVPRLVLDTGCGSGELLVRLLADGVPPECLYGVDIVPGHAEVTRRRTGLRTVYCADLRKFAESPAVRGSFDIVCAINWLQTEWTDEAMRGKFLPADEAFMVEILEAVKKLIAFSGLFIWEWHTTSPHPFRILLERMGWHHRDTLTFTTSPQFPEPYPVFVHSFAGLL